MSVVMRNAIGLIQRSINTYIFKTHKATEIPIKDLIGIVKTDNNLIIFEKHKSDTNTCMQRKCLPLQSSVLKKLI